MPAAPAPSEADARAEYERRLVRRRHALARQERLESLWGNGRVATFVAALAVAWFAFGSRQIAPVWMALPAVAFVAVSAAHARARGLLDRARRSAAFYEAGVARLDGLWPGSGRTGERFLDGEHPYAADLDLLGRGSLFERLCRARTEAGEATLASWLLAPAAPAEIVGRQEAVTELRPRLDLREELDLLGADVRAAVNPEHLTAWGTAPPAFTPARLRVALFALSALTLASIAGWLAGWLPRAVPLSVLIAQLVVTAFLRPRVLRVVGVIDRASRDLGVLAAVLWRLEREPLNTPRLRALSETLATEGRPASVQIARLARLAEQLEWQHNQLFAPVALLLMWTTHHAVAVESWRLRWGPRVRNWLSALGEFEALVSLAAYAFENPNDPFPEIVPSGALFDGRGLAHPLLPPANAVPNDVALGVGPRLLVVSGSNMSGKSTLLRTVGVNAVLALAGAPVRARTLRLSPLAVGATLRIQDSLREGRSRFFAEIVRVRRLVELAAGDPPLLFLLDELFQGTNSHDRRLGAEAVVRGLVQTGAIGLITTHDLALTNIADRLGPLAANVHFEDHFEDGAMTFDYRVRPGVVRKSNALALMRAVGLDVPLDGEASGPLRPAPRGPAVLPQSE